jgi:TonB family protein
MRARLWTGLSLLLCSFVVLAAGPGAVRKQVESSMLVTGSIEVDAGGKVTGFGLDQQESLPPGIVELIRKSVPAWTFEPLLLDGAPVNVKTNMGLRIVARKIDEQRYDVDIRSASFGKHEPGESVSSKKLRAPAYPTAAAQSGTNGTVYLLLRVGKDGVVKDVVAEQVNLRVVASEADMTRWRQVLERSAMSAARKWTFNPPQSGEEAGADFWSVRVPVDYRLDHDKGPRQGQWEAYVPGPRQIAPWLRRDELAASGADALVAGGVYQVGRGLRLLTPLGAG